MNDVSRPMRTGATVGRRGGAHAVAVIGTLGLLVGCSTLGHSDPKLRIEPVYKVRHSAGSSHGHYLTGRYHDGMRAWSLAIDAYRKAIAADPRNVEAYNALGAALAQAGRHAEAEAAFREGLALDPGRAHVRSNLGYVLLLAGKARDAITQLEEAVRLDPANAIARNNLQQARTQWAVLSAPEPAALRQAPQGGQGNLGAARRFLESGATGEPDSAPVAAASPVAIQAAAPMAVPLSSSVAAWAPVVVDTDTPLVPAPTPAAMPQVPPSPALARLIDRPTVPAFDRRDAASTSGIEIRLPRQIVHLSSVAGAVSVAAPAAAASPPAAPVSIGRLEVSNGNGITGAGARLRLWLAAQGTSTHRLTNQRPFTQRATVIQYRAGHEAAAQRLAAILQLAARPDTVAKVGLRADVRIVLGHDWTRIAACIERDACATQAAATARR